jgi:nitrite reductase/ring-hydroxylating ferredoxin subunit
MSNAETPEVADDDEFVVGRTSDLAEGERMIVLLDGAEVGVFNVGGEYVAYPNWCPHMGAPLCEGPLDGTIESSFDKETLETDLSWGREDEMLSCPWHGFEFDVTSGECRSDGQYKLREFPTRVEDGHIIVSLGFA